MDFNKGILHIDINTKSKCTCFW